MSSKKAPRDNTTRSAADERPAPLSSMRPSVGAVAKAVAVVAIVAVVWANWDQEAFWEWKEDAGPVPFFLALAVLPAVGVPTTPFYLLAGAAFPTALALGGSMAALVVNLLICYAVSKGPPRRIFVRWLEARDYELPDLKEKGAWRFSLIVKFMPGVPAFAKNYLLGIAGVPFSIYMIVSVFASSFYIASFVILGESAIARDPGKAAAAAAALLLAGGLAWWVRREKRRSAEDGDDGDDEGP